MTQRIQLKRQANTPPSSAVGKKPDPSTLLDGELAVNTVDGTLFLKRTDENNNVSIVTFKEQPFPTQTNNGGKFLTTDGTNVTWSTPSTVSAAAIDIFQAAHGFAEGHILYHDGTRYALAIATSVASSDVIGIVTKVVDADKFTLVTNGFVNFQGAIPDGTWTPGTTYYLSANTPGVLTNVEPSTSGTVSKPILVAINSTAYVGDTYSGGPRGFFINWRGIKKEAIDINTILPPQGPATVGRALVSDGASSYWDISGTNDASSSLLVSQAAHNLAIGTIVRYDGTTARYVKAQANNATNADVIGIISQVSSPDEFTVVTQGFIGGLSGLTPGASYFLSDTTAGGYIPTEPSALGAISKPVLMATSTSAALVVNMRGISISILDTTHEVAPQTGHANQYLTTNGISTSWGTPVTLFNGRNSDVTLTATDITSAGGALLDSPALTGNPTAPTQLATDNDTSIANTAFVHNCLVSYLPLIGGTVTGSIYGMLPIAMSQDSGVTRGSFVCRSTGTGDANLAGMTFHNDAYAIKMGVRADGYFGLGGWSRGAWSWYSTPTGDMIAAGNIAAYSDPRLKENFARVQDPIGILSKLDGGTFNWKSGIAHTEVKAGTRDYGILADQVEVVMPEIVSESIEIEGDRYKVVAYEKLVPVLIEAIKELNARLTVLENK
jgi:hypothetical protein